MLLLLKKQLLKAKHLRFCFEVLFRNNPVADFSGGVFLFGCQLSWSEDTVGHSKTDMS